MVAALSARRFTRMEEITMLCNWSFQLHNTHVTCKSNSQFSSVSRREFRLCCGTSYVCHLFCLFLSLCFHFLVYNFPEYVNRVFCFLNLFFFVSIISSSSSYGCCSVMFFYLSSLCAGQRRGNAWESVTL